MDATILYVVNQPCEAQIPLYSIQVLKEELLRGLVYLDESEHQGVEEKASGFDCLFNTCIEFLD